MAVIYMEQASFLTLTEKDIRDIVDANLTPGRYATLESYYQGKHKVLQERKRDSTAPNNRIVNNMARYITDTAVGYFLGQPVVYSSPNETYLTALQDIFDYNDEQDLNTELAKLCSIDGHAVEMLYIDTDGMIRQSKLNPGNVVLIYASDTQALLGALRTIISTDKSHNQIKKVEWWDSQQCWSFRSFNGGSLELMDIQEHYWHDVPFIEYLNNEERLGDFEGVISIIDAYNRVQSNTANFFQYNDEALLKITKMGDVTSQDVRNMKEKGAIILEDGGDIDWLIKSINDTGLENYKKRLREDMHLFSSVPNLTDENFGGSLSGVAISYKLWGLEQVCAIKERKFKKGLQRRLELLTTILNLKGGSYDYRDIDIQFRRNKPQNLLEIAQIMSTLAPQVSHETLLQMLPTIDNVKDELERIAKEEEEAASAFGRGGGEFEAVSKALAAFQVEDVGGPPPSSTEEGTEK